MSITIVTQYDIPLMHKIENKISKHIFLSFFFFAFKFNKDYNFYYLLDLSLKEFKINEKEVLKILTEVAVTRSEAEIVIL